jgi:cytochrome c-type biogenesis protein CcmH/NrfG
MNRNLISGLAIGVFAGFLIGYFVGAGRSNDVPPPVATAAVGATSGVWSPPTPQVNPMDVQARITSTKLLLANDPKIVNAWINLGNDYFDTHQAQDSVDAYAKALALKPDNPDVLTDQGIMYRELKAYDKAIANFKQANQLNPKHLQCLYNLGVVYSEDLKKPDEALKVWNKIIATDPASPQAGQARQAIDGLNARKP